MQWILTQGCHSGLHHEHGGAGHHPGVVIVNVGVPALRGQTPPGLRLWISDAETLLAVLLVTEQNITLKMNSVGVRKPANIIELA